MIDYATAGDLLERLADVWTRFDGDDWVELFTDDVVDRRDPFGVPLVGHNAVRGELLAMAEIQEQVELTWERHWVVAPTILAAWHLGFVDRRTHDRVAVAGFVTLEIADDGRIERARWWSERRVTPAGG